MSIIVGTAPLKIGTWLSGAVDNCGQFLWQMSQSACSGHWVHWSLIGNYVKCWLLICKILLLLLTCCCCRVSRWFLTAPENSGRGNRFLVSAVSAVWAVWTRQIIFKGKFLQLVQQFSASTLSGSVRRSSNSYSFNNIFFNSSMWVKELLVPGLTAFNILLLVSSLL